MVSEGNGLLSALKMGGLPQRASGGNGSWNDSGWIFIHKGSRRTNRGREEWRIMRGRSKCRTTSDGLLRLFRSPTDWDRLSREAKKSMEQYSPEKWANAWAGIIEK